MGIQKKAIVGAAFMLIASLCFVTGCAKEKPRANNTGVIPISVLQSIANGGEVYISDDSAASMCWTPKNQRNTLYEVTSWLRQAEPYQGKIPPSKISETMFRANVEPSKLNLSFPDTHSITLQPAFYLELNADHSFKRCYVNHVLQLTYDGKRSFITSSRLFDWLKNNKWKIEFEIES